jgi:hypothetical protein
MALGDLMAIGLDTSLASEIAGCFTFEADAVACVGFEVDGFRATTSSRLVAIERAGSATTEVSA